MGTEAWRATVHRVAELDMTEQLHTHTHTHTHTHILDYSHTGTKSRKFGQKHRDIVRRSSEDRAETG